MQFHTPYHIYIEKYPSKRLALYSAIRVCIASGVLAIDTRLPSSREMAALYGLSRGTVNEVYGYATARHTPKTCHGWHVPIVAHIGSEPLPDRGQGSGISTVVHSPIARQRRSQESVCHRISN
ncbi:GntR family transcriptional regulator [Paenibacillus thiaminolyticus]|uniref:GntR family transcriptional regulator n=1 Tax=Paenibacillus thiaminolyticus TaxID=49283 RepID=UPI0035A651C0